MRIDLSIFAKTYTLAKALLTGETVSEERLRKRLEICRTCPNVEKNGNNMHCGICGCKVKESGLVNLARFEETNDYGCKHGDGSQWKANGV